MKHYLTLPRRRSAAFVNFAAHGAIGTAHEPLLGPLTVAGDGVTPTTEAPWPFFDSCAEDVGLLVGSNFPDPAPGEGTADFDAYIGYYLYYDQGLVQWVHYYRTGNVLHRTYALNIAASWWESWWINNGTQDPESVNSPRLAALGGLMLTAMYEDATDTGAGPAGKSNKWDWINHWCEVLYPIWLGNHLTDSELYLGIRDGAFLLLYMCWLAQVLPDSYVATRTRDTITAGDTISDGATKRATWLSRCVSVSYDYYCRLQWPSQASMPRGAVTDGSWRWKDAWAEGADVFASQPFMHGYLTEALIAVHRLIASNPTFGTEAVAVASAITGAADHVYSDFYDTTATHADFDSIPVRAMWYVAHHPTGGDTRDPYVGGNPAWVREQRQLNAPLIHAFGYAYKLTGNSAYLTQGDEIASAIVGKDSGTGADGQWGLQDYYNRYPTNASAKEHDQLYRTAGRYMAWRLGA